MEIAVYGKGGIGKSTICANLSAALALEGKHILQIGCDPKHDSTRLLLGGRRIPTVMEYLRDIPKESAEIGEILKEGILQIGCIETGGPRPGVGCAGRGIISAFEFLERNNVKSHYDMIIYDVLGDVVCGGFAVPIRREYADTIFLVTSGEFMAIYAANNILRGIRNYDGDRRCRVAGILYNARNIKGERERVERFANAAGLPVIAEIPRSNAFSSAEEKNVPVVMLPQYKEEREVFLSLAKHIARGMVLYEACPVDDEELERVVLQPEEKPSFYIERKEVLSKEDPDEEAEALSEENREREAEAHSEENPEEKAETFKMEDQEQKSLHPSEDNDSGKRNVHQRNDSDFSCPKRLPLYGCAFNGAVTTAVHLSDACVIAHSPRSCAFYTWQNITSTGRKNLFNRGILMPSSLSPNFISTQLTQKEVVFGGMDRLRESVREAAARGEKAVIVVSSCVSGIIGDDVFSVEEMSTEKTPVLVIPADGDIAGDYMEGIRMCLHKIGNALIDRNVKPKGRLVNLIGEASVSNNIEVNYRTVRDMLRKMNIEIHCRFLGEAKVSEVRSLLEAPLNILSADSLDNQKLKTWLQQEYGCVFADEVLPVGFEETCRFLRKIGTFFDCTEKAEPVISDAQEEYRERIRRVKHILAGKRLLMTTISVQMDWLFCAAADAGMEIVWVGVIDYLRQGTGISGDPGIMRKVEEITDILTVERKIRELKPDLVISNYTSAVSEGDYIKDNLPMTQQIGFFSGVNVLERWAERFSEVGEGEWILDREYDQKYYC